MLQNISFALTVAETCSQPLDGCKILPLVTHTVHGIPMHHAPGERGHPRGFQDSRQQRRSPNVKLGFSFPWRGASLLHINIIPSQDVQWHPAAGA